MLFCTFSIHSRTLLQQQLFLLSTRHTPAAPASTGVSRWGRPWHFHLFLPFNPRTHILLISCAPSSSFSCWHFRPFPLPPRPSWCGLPLNRLYPDLFPSHLTVSLVNFPPLPSLHLPFLFSYCPSSSHLYLVTKPSFPLFLLWFLLPFFFVPSFPTQLHFLLSSLSLPSRNFYFSFSYLHLVF